MVTELVLGIDGGGTKTLAWLAAANGHGDPPPLGEGLAGPGNPRSAGFDQALANIDLAVTAAFTSAGLPRQTVAAACLGLAGADRAAERSRLEAWCATRNLSRKLVITNDAEPLLAAASPDAWGIVLLAGTGSFAFGRNRAGVTARCGGWGYLLGDEGSGYALGTAALRAAARAADGRAVPSQLLPRLQQRLRVDSPQGIIEAVYRADFQRRDVAELSEVVFEAAQDGDRTAQDILATAVSELAELVRTLAVRLEFQAGQYPLVAAGGILLHHPEMLAGLERKLAATAAAPARIHVEENPVRGAVVLARRALTG